MNAINMEIILVAALGTFQVSIGAGCMIHTLWFGILLFTGWWTILYALYLSKKDGQNKEG